MFMMIGEGVSHADHRFLIICVIVSGFAVFAVALAWDDYQTRVIFRKAGRKAVANVRIMQELCTFVDQLVVHAYTMTLARIARRQRRFGECNANHGG
jgi:hypothetical protein